MTSPATPSSSAPVGDPAYGLPELDYTDIGPRVGERFPDIVLPDQTDTPIDLHAHRGGRKGLVVFHRSADW